MGRTVAIDPETGQLGAPSPEQIRELQAGAARATVSRTDEGLVETRFPDGTVMIRLDERFQDFAIMRLDRNGKPIPGCVHHDDGLKTALRDTSAAPALEEE